MMHSVPSHSIRERLAALELAVADAERDFDIASSAAIAGEPDAGRLAAEIDTRLSRLATDRRILDRALQRAEAAERDAAEAQEAARRKAHVADASESSGRLLDACKRADNILADLSRNLEEIAGLEQDIRRSLMLAKVQPQAANAWQGKLVGLAVEHASRIIDGRARYTAQPRSLVSAAGSAWGFLHNNKEVHHG